MHHIISILFTGGLLINYPQVLPNYVSQGDLLGSNRIDPEPQTFYLTPWELSVLSELYIEISILKCPTVVKSTARTLEKFMGKKMALAETTSDLLNYQFFAVYQQLVGCVSELEAHSGLAHLRPDDPEMFRINQELERDEAVLEAEFEKVLLTVKPTRMLNSTGGVTRTGTEHESILTTAWKWLSKIFSHRDTPPLTTRLPDKRRQQVAAEDLEDDIKTNLARKEFYAMMEMFTQVLFHACPAKFRPDSQFTEESIKEIVEAVALDPSMIDKAADFYFSKKQLRQQLQDCVRTWKT